MMSSSPTSGPRHAVSTDGRCVSCGSRLRPDDAWCSLCHTPVATESVPAQWAPPVTADPAPDNDTTPADDPVEQDDLGPDGLGKDDEDDVAPGGLRPDPGPEVSAAADQMIAELAAMEARRERESGVGLLRQRFSGLSPRAAALVLAAGVGVGLLVVIILGLTVVGLVV